MSAVLENGVAPRVRIRLWDLPLRIFHWALVIAVATAIVTGELGGPWMALHGKAGLTIVGLVVFRLGWGLIGSTHARFAHFAPTPLNLAAYLRGRWRGTGHNPLGALSVFALLGLLALQAGTGLFSNDDISFSGPLFNAIDDALAGRLTGLHRKIAWVLLALLALHVAAIVYHLRFRKDNLVKPMLTGWKEVESGELTTTTATAQGGPLAFIVSVALALGVVLAINAVGRGAPILGLVGNPAPPFALARLDNAPQRFGPQDMKGRVWLFNAWASWCTSCRQEHALLLDLARRGVAPIVGLNYMDNPQDGARWLARHGNPYQLSVVDRDGMAGTAYGVHALPATLVIDKQGVVRLMLTGPITAEIVENRLLPLIRELGGRVN